MGRIQKETSENRVAQRTEIRDFGDRETVVLYTTDNLIYQTLKGKAQKEIPYEIWKNCNPHQASKVAVDLYFPKTSKNAVKTISEQLQKVGQNAVKSTRIQKLLKAI